MTFALHVLLLTLVLAVPCAEARSGGPAGKPRVRSLSPRLAAARDLGPAPAEAPTTVLVSLALRGRTALERFLQDVQDPTSPRYHRYLEQRRFVAHHAPTVKQEQAVIAYLQQHGFRITYRATNRLLVGAEGSVAATEQAFGARLHDVVVGGEVRRAALEEPTVPADLADYVVGILGLGDAGDMKSHLKPHPAQRQAPGDACCAFGPPELARFYDSATGYDGRGQTIAIVGLYAWSPADVSAFDRLFGLPPLPAGSTQICTGSSARAAGCAYSPGLSAEVSLDVEYAHATAPRAKIINYMAASPTYGDFAVLYNTVVAGGGRRAARSARGSAGWVVTTSFGTCESTVPDAWLATYDNILANANAIGQSWFAASGDYGSRDCNDVPSVDFPASSPHVVGVGGTTPMCDNPATCDRYGYETAWSGSGGGRSKFFARPAFQHGCGVPEGSHRLVPDVALASDPLPGIFYRHAGAWHVTGGTSAAAPQWAGFFAQLNQRASQRGLRAGRDSGGDGAGNPAARLYALCGSDVFHDVLEGDNGDYQATPGYDMTTGLGSVDVSSLLTQY